MEEYIKSFFYECARAVFSFYQKKIKENSGFNQEFLAGLLKSESERLKCAYIEIADVIAPVPLQSNIQHSVFCM